MKSLEELMAIKAKMAFKGDMRVLVGIGTCGIAAGALPVLKVLAESVEEAGMADKIQVTQTGCVGVCQYEPVVEIYDKEGKRTTYVKMNAEKAKEVFEKHIKGGEIITEYTIGAAQL